MRYKANVEGIDKMIARLRLVGADVQQAAVEAVEEATELLKEESISRAPVDTGDLEECHDTKVHAFKNNQKVVGVVFIDDSKMQAFHYTPTSQYAIIMHEHLAPYGSGEFQMREASRQKRASGHDVGGKFLLRALEDNRERIAEIIRERLYEAFRRAVSK